MLKGRSYFALNFSLVWILFIYLFIFIYFFFGGGGGGRDMFGLVLFCFIGC